MTTNDSSEITISDQASDSSGLIQPPARTSWGVKLNLLIVWILLAGAGYWFYQEQSVATDDSAQGLYESNEQQLLQQASELTSLQKQLAEINTTLLQTTEVDPRIEQLAQRIHNMQTVNRSDWVLAEAEYLLRLANQRLLMDKGIGGSLPLLKAADAILHDIDDMDLFAVRKALANDIAALKLTSAVDRNGLYLELSALTSQIMALPDFPSKYEIVDQATPAADAALKQIDASLLSTEANLTLWQRVQKSFWSAAEIVGRYIRIRHHEQPILPLMSPPVSDYVRQNLRLKLEQAQLALLQENQLVYQHSLQAAQALLQQYFSSQTKAELLIDELDGLANKNIVVKLPDISGSLAALKNYITEFHDLSEPASGKSS